MHVKEKVAGLSLISNSLLVLTKLAAGLATGSVSVVSEAAHSGLDLMAAMIAFFSVRESAKPADERHRYGHGKIENVSGTVEALLIVIAAVWIIQEAGQRLMNQRAPDSLGQGIMVMALSVVVNIYVSRRLLKVARATDSIALEADALHLTTDVYTSLGVLVGLALLYLTGWSWLDPLVALVVAGMILKAAWDLTRKAFLPLVDVSLPVEEEKTILEILREHADLFSEFHKLRTRRAGPDRHIDLHLVMPRGEALARAHDLSHHISGEIEARFTNTYVLIHLEPCNDDCPQCGAACESRH